MKIAATFRWPLVIVLLIASLAGASAVKSEESSFSGISEYSFEPSPQEIKPKMYNWEIKLNRPDSRNGTYEIAQITTLKKSGSMAADSTTTVLVDSKIIVPNQDGIIDFKLYVGDKEPKQNMGRRGNIGQPIIFSGIGTANAQSGWIILPGTKVDQVVPSGKGTPLLNGRLSLIQFTVTNDGGETFQADVILRRK
jgi:hypothetical protein